MPSTDDFSQAEIKCELKTKSFFKMNLELNDKILNFYLKIIDKYGKQEHSGGDLTPIVSFFLHAKIIKSLYCLTGLVKKGQYQDFFAIQRNVVESIYLSQFLFENPKYNAEWLKGAQINHKKFSKDSIEIPAIKDIYGILCDYTHSNSRIIWPYVKSNDTKKTEIKLTPQFDELIAYYAIIMQMLFTLDALDHHIEVIKKFQGNLDTFDEQELERLRKQSSIQLNKWEEYCGNHKKW
jgi:hypothetical protein